MYFLKILARPARKLVREFGPPWAGGPVPTSSTWQKNHFENCKQKNLLAQMDYIRI